MRQPILPQEMCGYIIHGGGSGLPGSKSARVIISLRAPLAIRRLDVDKLHDERAYVVICVKAEPHGVIAVSKAACEDRDMIRRARDPPIDEVAGLALVLRANATAFGEQFREVIVVEVRVLAVLFSPVLFKGDEGVANLRVADAGKPRIHAETEAVAGFLHLGHVLVPGERFFVADSLRLREFYQRRRVPGAVAVGRHDHGQRDIVFAGRDGAEVRRGVLVQIHQRVADDDSARGEGDRSNVQAVQLLPRDFARRQMQRFRVFLRYYRLYKQKSRDNQNLYLRCLWRLPLCHRLCMCMWLSLCRF